MATYFAQSQLLHNLDILKDPEEEKADRLLAGIVFKTDEANGLVSKKKDELDILWTSIPQCKDILSSDIWNKYLSGWEDRCRKYIGRMEQVMKAQVTYHWRGDLLCG